MEQFIIYTTLGGNNYFMCYTKAKGAYVKSNASDDEIMKLDSEDEALTIASNNSDSSVTYKVKPIKQITQ